MGTGVAVNTPLNVGSWSFTVLCAVIADCSKEQVITWTWCIDEVGDVGVPEHELLAHGIMYVLLRLGYITRREVLLPPPIGRTSRLVIPAFDLGIVTLPAFEGSWMVGRLPTLLILFALGFLRLVPRVVGLLTRYRDRLGGGVRRHGDFGCIVSGGWQFSKEITDKPIKVILRVVYGLFVPQPGLYPAVMAVMQSDAQKCRQNPVWNNVAHLGHFGSEASEPFNVGPIRTAGRMA